MTEVRDLSLSRRNLFRITGAGAGGVAVATVAKPSLAVAASQGGKFTDPAGRPNRPWWVKTVDQPTTEIDWSMMKRFNEKEGTLRGGGLAKYAGQDEADRIMSVAEETELQRLKDGVDGYTLKDHALNAAHIGPEQSFLGPQQAKTPQERGVEKWEGSPEEASKIIRAAMRHFGAATVGFIELNDDTRNLIYSVDPDGKELIFTDDELASETEVARNIPTSCKYAIVYTVQMSQEAMRRSPTVTGQQTTTLAYKRGQVIQGSTQEFLRGLGYQGLGESTTNALGIAPALGVMAGLGEMSRLNRLITPEFGPMVRVFKILTDLPLAIDKPIDAGIMEFCKRCKKCADSCPSESLSFEDEPTWETRGEWNNPGHKAYFENSLSCMTYWREKAGTNCGICFSVCPFSKKDKAWVHDWVKAGTALAPGLTPFFRTMDDAFGFGVQAGSEEWWGLDLPEFGIDSTQSVQEG